MRALSSCLLAMCGAAAGGAAATPVLAPAAKLTSTASVEVTSEPSAIFAELSDPRRWPAFLSDVTRVERESSAEGSFTVLSKLMGHAHVIELALERDRLVHFHVTDAGIGGALVVDIRLEPLTARGTRVWYTMKTVLPLGLDGVVGDDVVRRVRERKIIGDLADIERRFGRVAGERARNEQAATPTP